MREGMFRGVLKAAFIKSYEFTAYCHQFESEDANEGAAHPAYITWHDYEENLRRLRENAQLKGVEKRSAPREGPSRLAQTAFEDLWCPASTISSP